MMTWLSMANVSLAISLGGLAAVIASKTMEGRQRAIWSVVGVGGVGGGLCVLFASGH